MVLIYIDESGTNYRNYNGLFVDGPFIITGAMFVFEDVYWSMERLFCDLIDEYFGIDNWFENELHATNIWAGKGIDAGITVEKRREFFDQFLQLCGKFGLPYVFAMHLKEKSSTKFDKSKNMSRCVHSLLIAVEHKLADLHQSGVLVCDATQGCDKITTRSVSKLTFGKKVLSSSEVLLREFSAMTAWRSTKGCICDFLVEPKYSMEAKSIYLLDRIHFVSSFDSLFIQMCDIITFIVQRCLVHDYLRFCAPGSLDPEMVPVTRDGLCMQIGQMDVAHYNERIKDVIYGKIRPVNSLLFDFESDPYYKSLLRDQYNRMIEVKS